MFEPRVREHPSGLLEALVPAKRVDDTRADAILLVIRVSIRFGTFKDEVDSAPGRRRRTRTSSSVYGTSEFIYLRI